MDTKKISIIAQLNNNLRTSRAFDRKCAKEKAQREREHVRKLKADIKKILASGIELDRQHVSSLSSGYIGCCKTLRVLPTDLPKWRAIGRLHAEGKEFSRSENGKDYITVSLKVEGLEYVSLEYERELPAGSKCSVVEQSYKTLVCQR